MNYIPTSCNTHNTVISSRLCTQGDCLHDCVSAFGVTVYTVIIHIRTCIIQYLCVCCGHACTLC